MFKSFWIGSIVLGLLSATVVGEDDAPKGPRIHVGAPGIKVDVQPGKVSVKALGINAIKLGDYWLGVECYPAPGALGAQLGLPEDQGLVVEAVVPDGPAAKAGLQPHDVLVTAGGKPLGSVPELVEAIEAAKDKALALELIRGGKQKKISVTPAKRPAEARGEGYWPIPGRADWDQVYEWFERIRPGRVDVDAGSMRFRFIRPGLILPRGAAVHPPLPANTSVTITKQGDQPAKIVVTRDDEKWEVTEDQLDKLPEDIRTHVARMLGDVPSGPTGQLQPFDFIPDWAVPGHPGADPKEAPKFHPAEPRKGRVEKRIDQMNRRIDQLRKSLDEMREERPQDEAPKENPDKV